MKQLFAPAPASAGPHIVRFGRIRSLGFSLLEVMIALVVLSIGLLGIVKLESASVASTTVAARRSLAALEASSLAASMHENRGYWAGGDPTGAIISATGNVVTVSTGAPALATALGTTPNCLANTIPCSVADMAAYELQQWTLAMHPTAAGVPPLLPNYHATITCGTGTPLACNIQLTWSENAVAVNAQEVSAASAAPSAPAVYEQPSYTLYVEP